MMRTVGGALVALAIVLITNNAASAQAGTATVNVRVEYPNGALVNDMNVCVVGSEVLADGTLANIPMFDRSTYLVGGRLDTPSGPSGTYTVPANTPLLVAAFSCGEHFGLLPHVLNESAVGLFEPSLDITRQAIRPAPGEVIDLTLPMTVGTIEGRVPANFAHPACSIHAIGIPDHGLPYEHQLATTNTTTGTYELRVPAGEYRVEIRCSYGVGHYPAGGALDSPERIRVDHGQRVTGANVGPLTGGDWRYVHVPVAELSQQATVCIDTVSTGGVRLHRDISQAGRYAFDDRTIVRVPVDQPMKLRFWDCADLGFDDVWYPDAADLASAESVIAPSNDDVFRIELPETVTFFGTAASQCDGRVPTIFGGPGSDVLVGTPGPDVIMSFGGDDHITSFGGDDVICAGAGADFVDSGDGDDRLFGEADRDRLFGGSGNDYFKGGSGSDYMVGHGGADEFYGGGHRDRIKGGKGPDFIAGNQGRDRIEGGPGNDTIYGNAKADWIRGEDGNDTIIGGHGNDLIEGGSGDDRIFGSGGADRCSSTGVLATFDNCELRR